MRPLISVVIPTKNELNRIGACLDGILSQTLADSLEIIVVDSGSTDGTLELLAKYPVIVERISPTEFNHGETRNLGVRIARGEFVVLTVGDARPVERNWIERMLAHFDDPQVAGVCGQQVVPHEPDKNPLQWFRPQSEPVPQKIHFASADEFEKLTPPEKVAVCAWDDVTAMYRRATLLELPFQRVGFAEDLVWAKDALMRGHALVYDHGARVYHYHHENFKFRFRREFTILYHLYLHFGHVTVPMWLLPELARCAHRAARRKYCPERRAAWFAYNFRLTLAQWLAGWVFWFVAKCGGKRLLARVHERVCAKPPQPLRSK